MQPVFEALQPDYQADVKVPDPGSCNRECKLPVENTPDVPSSGRDEGLHDCALQYDLGPVGCPAPYARRVLLSVKTVSQFGF